MMTAQDFTQLHAIKESAKEAYYRRCARICELVKNYRTIDRKTWFKYDVLKMGMESTARDFKDCLANEAEVLSYGD